MPNQAQKPVQNPAPAQIPVQVPGQQAQPAPQQAAAKYKVLLVEDDSFLSSLIKGRLQKKNIEIIHALDGDQAIELLKNNSPNLILLDLILPKKSGFEVMEIIQGDPHLKKCPIIIISNLGQDSDIEKGRELGAIEYFVKAQTSIDELVNKIEGFLKQKKW